MLSCGPNLGFAKIAAEPNYHAGNAAVAHQQVGAGTEKSEGDIARLGGKKFSKIVGIDGAKQYFRRAADAKPGDFGKRLVREQPPAQLRRGGCQFRQEIRKGHHFFAASSPGSA